MSSFPVANVLSFPSGAGLSCSIMSDSLRPPGLYPARPLCPWGFSRQEHWHGLPCPPPADLPNPGLPHCGPILYHLSHRGSPRVLEWVAYHFSRGSSQPRNWTRVSCIAGRFFTSWATWEAPGVFLSWWKHFNFQDYLPPLLHCSTPCSRHTNVPMSPSSPSRFFKTNIHLLASLTPPNLCRI